MKAQDKRPDDAQRNVERTLLVTTQIIGRELHVANGKLLRRYCAYERMHIGELDKAYALGWRVG